MPSAPKGYIIDVCRFCGAHAIWPFSCGHQEPGWTVPLHVSASTTVRNRLQREIDQSRQRDR